ncbi:MAG: hypothetical protein JWO72_1215 [Caulobacteraceae bacterium]|nr:hypothetical protein [Caulobacteraceae bacterium]
MLDRRRLFECEFAFAGADDDRGKIMDRRIVALFASAMLSLPAGAALAQDQAASPPGASAAPTLLPAMTAPLAANANPMSFDLGPFGNKVYVTGALTGIALAQGHHVPGDLSSQADISNAQIMINKPDGLLEYFVQVGDYALPALGAPYLKSTTMTNAAYGVVPQAFVKLAPTGNFSVEVGKLPTLIGSEYTFSFENSNIERGLLWGQEPAVSRGVQANYSTGPWAFSLSWNDGFYSNQYNTVSGAATWTINPANILVFSASGNTKTSRVSSFATPTYLNNESIYNLIYTHTAGPWSFTPYFQYTSIPRIPAIGAGKQVSTVGGALLATYTFDAKSPLAGFSLPARVEYISSSGSQADGSESVLYGPGSKAWSFTVTPTFVYKVYFVRAELSYTSASDTAPAAAFGLDGNAKSQTRGLIETGLLF